MSRSLRTFKLSVTFICQHRIVVSLLLLLALLSPIITFSQNNTIDLGKNVTSSQIVNDVYSIINKSRDSILIASAVDGDSNAVKNNGSSSSNSITFTFDTPGLWSGTPIYTGGDLIQDFPVGYEIRTFGCTLDSTYIYPCKSPVRFNNLSQYRHDFKVEGAVILVTPHASSMAGILFESASFNWNVLSTNSSTVYH